MDLALDDLEGILDARVGVVAMFGSVGAVLPADPAVLAAVWPTAPAPRVGDIAEAVTALVADGAVRVVVLGSEPHLVAVPRNETFHPGRPETEHVVPAEPAAVAPAAAVPAAPTAEESVERDALAVRIDVEQERLVLYRVAIVVEVIVALIFLRGLL